ncbi:MAG: hypothetical protein K2I45_02635 [Muribaculaceae bacterium]|nr:hypothetical protein [Muribaculaceae bacterium]
MKLFRQTFRLFAAILVTAGLLPSGGCQGHDSQEAQAALSALREAESCRKGYVAVKDTTGIERAITFFRQTGDRKREAEGLYFSGYAAFKNGDMHKAVERGLESNELSKAIGHDMYGARAHELLADAYREVFNLKVSRIHRRQAVELYSKAGMRKNAFYAALDLASEYSHEDNDSALILLRSALDYADRGDIAEMAHHSLLSADICRVRGEYKEALAHFRSITPTVRAGLLTEGDSVHIGEIYWHNAMPDSAVLWFSTPAASTDIQYWKCMADGYESAGDSRRALEATKKTLALEYDKTGESLSNSLEYTERRFYERKARDAEEKHRRLAVAVSVCGGVMLIALLVTLLVVYYRRNKSLKTETEIKDVALLAGELLSDGEETVSVCKEDYGSKKSDNKDSDNKDSDTGTAEDERNDEHKEKWINVILDFYMQRLNQISREYFKVTDEQSLKEIETEFNRELRSLRDGDIFDEIERRLDERNDGIASKIRKQFPKFNEQYVRLMLCSLAGLSSQSTCLLLSVSKGNYYMMWTRIRTRIRASEVPDKPLFESLFTKRT